MENFTRSEKETSKEVITQGPNVLPCCQAVLTGGNTVYYTCGTFHAVRRHDGSPAHAGPLGSVLCVRSAQRVNWKINSNLNYWNKELQDLQIKKKTLLLDPL